MKTTRRSSIDETPEEFQREELHFQSTTLAGGDASSLKHKRVGETSERFGKEYSNGRNLYEREGGILMSRDKDALICKCCPDIVYSAEDDEGHLINRYEQDQRRCDPRLSLERGQHS